MSLFVIRHVASGNLLPKRFVSQGKLWEGKLYREDPRVFHTRHSAATFITHWIHAKPDRTRDMLEIVPATVTIIKDKDYGSLSSLHSAQRKK